MIYTPLKFTHLRFTHLKFTPLTIHLIKLSRHAFLPSKDLGNAIQLVSNLGVVCSNISLALAFSLEDCDRGGGGLDVTSCS